MAPPEVNGVVMTAQRRRAILALYKVGGELAPAPGEKRIPSDRQHKLLKMSTGAVAAMAKDGIVTRDMNKTSTRSIVLSPKWMDWAKQQATEQDGAKTRQRRSPQRRTQRRTPRRGKRTADVTLEEVPLPSIGTAVTVFLIQQDEDGTAYIGLRDGSKSWLTRVQMHSDRES